MQMQSQAHVRNILDASVSNWATGAIVVFTIEGRVIVDLVTAFCTTSLGAGAGTIQLGDAVDNDSFMPPTVKTSLDADDWWMHTTTVSGAFNAELPSDAGQTDVKRNKAISTDIIITNVTAAVTSGVVVFDAWYTPITDGAYLAAA